MPNGPLFISRPYCSRARFCNTGLDASMRARYSGEMGGDPAGRSSNDRQWTTRSYCFSSFSKLEATKKQKGQTKSDQTSTRIAMSQNFLLVVTTCSYSIHYARIHLPKSPSSLRHLSHALRSHSCIISLPSARNTYQNTWFSGCAVVPGKVILTIWSGVYSSRKISAWKEKQYDARSGICAL